MKPKLTERLPGRNEVNVSLKAELVRHRFNGGLIRTDNLLTLLPACR